MRFNPLYLKKNPTKPYKALRKHLKKMQRGNDDFYLGEFSIDKYIMGTGKIKAYADIWQHFKKEEFHSSPSFIYLYNVLYELGVLANVEIVKISLNQVYESINQAVANWQMRLGLEPAQRNELQSYLLNRLEESAGKYCLPGEGRTAIISVELLDRLPITDRCS